MIGACSGQLSVACVGNLFGEHGRDASEASEAGCFGGRCTDMRAWTSSCMGRPSLRPPMLSWRALTPSRYGPGL